ncbi:TPA: hypothetical protein ACGSOM_002416 [Escherichia coli]
MPVAKRPSTDPPQWLTTVAPLRRVPALFHHPGGYTHELPSPGRGVGLHLFLFFCRALFLRSQLQFRRCVDQFCRCPWSLLLN